MRLTFIIGVLITITVLLNGCAASDPVLATIGDEKITLHSFEDKFVQSNGGWDSSAVSPIQDRQRFLDLMIKFKLEVKEAYAHGLEKDSAVVNEIDLYHNSILQTYILDKEVIEPGIKKFYDRKKEEIRVSHILFRVPRAAAPEDTVKAYNLAMNIIDQIAQVPFDTLAFRYSEDPSAKVNYGDIGFFSAGKMVPEFEEACFSLKTGEYTKIPVRTQFGYHIIKLTARRPNSGSVHLSHILFKFKKPKNDTSGVNDTSAVRDTAWMVYRKLKNGASFKELVKKYSQDPQSAGRDGDLGFFERSRIVPFVGNIIFNLKADSVSEPIEFVYGFHIFRVTEKRPFPEFEELKNELRTQYQQTQYQNDYKNYVKMLRAKYKLVADSAVVNLLPTMLDTTKTIANSNWEDTLTSDILAKTIIRSADRQYSIRNFIDGINLSGENTAFNMNRSGIWVMVNKMLDIFAIEQHGRKNAYRYPELNQVLQESKDATLKDRINQDEVQKKIVINDSLLNNYYNLHKDEYRWPERVNFAEIHTSTDSLAKMVYKKIQKGMNFLDAAKEYTNRPGYKEKKGVWGFQVYSFNDLSLKASKMAKDSIIAPFNFEGGWSIIKTLDKDDQQLKTFEEALPEITSAYQEEAASQREQKWIDELMRKYPVKINKEVLINAFKKKRP